MTVNHRFHADRRILGRDYYGYGWRFSVAWSGLDATSDRELAGGTTTANRCSRSRS
ncbi:hypothetical protein [Halomonas caseinilytica]|uniref:hypothetical protein n=1 Tax=Halomonas caseinilytica TaxID=438744 RepID=UPI0008B056BE|nr:hypothetical protein [Halomonas caseinilytica]SEM01731.1 hypothetical protein SAMN04487952_101151 [Halomonas caseinilytica]